MSSFSTRAFGLLVFAVLRDTLLYGIQSIYHICYSDLLFLRSMATFLSPKHSIQCHAHSAKIDGSAMTTPMALQESVQNRDMAERRS